MKAADAIATLIPFLQENGFSRSGLWFYRICGDLAQCVVFETPSLLYCRYCVIPLFFPCEFRYCTFGNRLTSEQGRPITLKLSVSSAYDSAQWAQNVKEKLCTDIFPFFRQISDVRKLRGWLNTPDISKYFFSPILWLEALRGHAAFYMGDFVELRYAVEEVQKRVNMNDCFAPEIKEDILNHLTVCLSFQGRPPHEKEAYLQTVMKNTLAICFPHYRSRI